MKLKKSQKQTYMKIFLTAGIIGIGGFLLAPEFLIPANAEEESNAIDPSKYSVSISSSNTINLNLETVPYTNVIRAGKDTITTSITHPTSTQSKFSLFVSMEGADNSLTNGTNTIPATSGTLENPVALTSNEWGFALANTTTGLPTNGFDETYNTPDPGKASKWAGVPTVENEQLIQNNLSMNQSSTTTDVYYAVSAKDNLAEGTYTGTVVYTAMYNASEANEMEVVSPVPFEGTTGTEITLNTAAITGLSDPGDVEIKLGDTPCENPTASIISGGQVQVKCTVPELPAAGDYTVTATLDKTGVTYTATDQFTYAQSGPLPACDDPIPSGGATYFQDFTSADKDKMTEEAQYKLIDKRDNKPYCVSKLKDGNVWMTQNLDLDITTEGLTNTDTDLNSKASWDASSEYAPKDTETTISSSTISTDTRSWSLGDYYYDGTSSASCGDTTSYSNCIGKGILAPDNPNADPHYHVGNLYQWNTATAGSGGTIFDQDAQDSICPKGWRLPQGGSAPNEFSSMLLQYGAWTSGTSGTVQNLIKKPVYMIRGGFISSGTLKGAVDSGYYWSSTAESSSRNQDVYYLVYNKESYVDPDSYSSRYYGFSVRCIAR